MSYLVGRDIRSKLHCNEPDFKEMIEMMQLEMDRIDSLSTLNMDRRTAEDYMSRQSSATEELKIVEESVEEDAVYDNEKFRNIACITDFANSLAHIYMLRYNITKDQSDMAHFQRLFAVKDACFETLAQYSIEQDGVFMGLSRDQNGKRTINCDIPGVGQISWHCPERRNFSIARTLEKNYQIGEYPYVFERGGEVQFNLDILSPDSNSARFGNHNRIVARSQNVSDMLRRLSEYNWAKSKTDSYGSEDR